MMNRMNEERADYEAQRMQADRAELVERIARAVHSDGVIEPLPGLHLNRRSATRGPVHSVVEPAFVVIAQGSKEVWLGDCIYRYDPFHYLLTTVELPAASRVLEATPERPYLSLRLTLSPAIVGSIIAELGQTPLPSSPGARAINVSPLDADLLNASVRLVRLLDSSPAEARILMPLITQEIVYRLLLGEQGDRLRHLMINDGYAPDIAKVIGRLRRNFDQPVRVEQLANELGMSVSGFHHHFKAVTALSPLQFQKRVRLQEARRLMLGENLDATSAAFRVGYRDAAHFNREYKRLFGEPPKRNVQHLRDTVARPLED